MALFEGYERRIDQINAVLNSYGISSIEEAEKITKDAGLDVYEQVKKMTTNYRVWNNVADYLTECLNIIADKVENAKAQG